MVLSVLNMRGFATVLLLLPIFILAIASAYVVSTKKTPAQKLAKIGPQVAQISEPGPSLMPTPTQIATPIQKTITSATPIPTPVTRGKISFHIGETSERVCGSNTCVDQNQDDPPKLLDRFSFHLINTQTNLRQEKPAVRDWTVENLSPGTYKVLIYFKDPYTWGTRPATCENCKESVGIGENWMCGYQIKLSPGDSPKLSCYFKNPNTMTPDTSDKTPPISNVYWPQPEGTMSYKTDGKYCVYMNPPIDNSSGTTQTRYAFDDNWVGWQDSNKTAYACTDNLSNGQHSFSYHSKDIAGNEESVKSFTFMVNIN